MGEINKANRTVKQQKSTAKTTTKPTTPVAPAMTAAQAREMELHDSQDALEFGDYTGTSNLDQLSNVDARSRALIKSGFNDHNSGEEGSGASQNIKLTPQSGAIDVKNIDPRFKLADRAVSAAISRAKADKIGIDDEAGFRKKFATYMKDAVGEGDANAINSNYMMPNLARTAWRLYKERASSYVPSRKKYQYNPTTDKLEPIGGQAPATTTPATTTPTQTAPSTTTPSTSMPNTATATKLKVTKTA